MTMPSVSSPPLSLTAVSATLAATLRARPEFASFQEAAARARADDRVQQHIAAMHKLQDRLMTHWSAEDEERLEDLERDMLTLPPMQAYTTAENALREMLTAVDAVISAAAGVPFAANARRGCGCGK